MGKKLFDSGKITIDSKATDLNVDISNVNILKLVVCHAGEKMRHGHADWVNPTLTRVSKKTTETTLSPLYQVKNKSVEIELSNDGEIAGIKFGKSKSTLPLMGKTNLPLCSKSNMVAKKLGNGGVEFSYLLTQQETKRQCQVKEQYYPTPTSIRWELEVTGMKESWSCPIESFFSWPLSQQSRIWLPWGNPDGKAIPAEWDREFDWQDPLVAVPFYNQAFNYGIPDFPEGNRGYVAYDGNNVSIPMISVLEPSTNQALSVICSPEDAILFQNIDVTQTGEIRFSRYYNRICPEKNHPLFS